MKPADLKCYKQVAAVIGEAYADYELQRVIDCEGCDLEKSITHAFNWLNSPQGIHFWAHICEGENPYEHGHDKPDLKVNIFEKALEDGFIVTELGQVVPESEAVKKQHSDGSTASYYELPEGATELQHLISHRNMNAQIGEIFRACYRYGLVSHSDMLRDAKKIKFYAQAEIERLEKLAQSDQ